MNIKEVEEQSGLSFANIRYYEKVGLVVPERRKIVSNIFRKINFSRLVAGS